VKWLTPVKPEKNACPASSLFYCSLIRSDAAAVDHKATPPPPVIRPPNAAADHQFVGAQLYAEVHSGNNRLLASSPPFGTLLLKA